MAEKRGAAPVDTDDYRSMRALEEIERNPNVSQRELASSLGVALGIANSLVHALVRKGLVKIRGDNNRTISYHLTKRGAAHKATLAMQWTVNTIDFYRQARQTVSAGLARIAEAGHPRIALLGANELAEIAIIVAPETPAEIVCVVRHAGTYVDRDVMLGVPLTDAAGVAAAGARCGVICLDPAKAEFAEMLAAFEAAAPGLPVYVPSGEPLAGGVVDDEE
ncbi:MAG: winged helix-turn-helix transcriptional regulator [Actinobacteria bacterium]|nr:MAG: winged helix-turn-helix transcriptional regulator [Actinomycetota bacterium]